MTAFFDNLTIQPLVFLINIIFVSIYDYFQQPAFSVILLSVIVNFMALPLYRKADIIQKAHQQKQKKMQPWVDHIRSVFKGDEQYMMLSAYYRIEKYHPASVLKESFPLLLQVPIFIAAYRYLSTSRVLIGATLGPIADLGNPDRLLRVGGLTINALPILMTLMNLLSGYVYARNGTLRQKLQIVGIAALFLALLYNSPSGLVLYWTTSQVFSLCKNLILETDVFRKRAVVLTLSFAVIFLSLVGMATRALANSAGMLISEVLLILAVIQLVRIIMELKGIRTPGFIERIRHFDALLPQEGYVGLALVGLCCVLLFGVCIPSSVLASSATEFVDSSTGRFLTELLTYPATVYAGLFLVWGAVFYYFTGEKGRKVLFTLLLSILGAALLNYFAFDIRPKFFYADLTFDGDLGITGEMIRVNRVLTIAAVIAVIWAWKRQKTLCRNAAGILAVALAILGGCHMIQIPAALSAEKTEQRGEMASLDDAGGILSLSRTEKNVIVLMLDRALGAYVPFIFDEKPELKEAFDGFVYYPNTLSFATYTFVGAPPLYGGYEYAPAALYDRHYDKQYDAQKEALRVLPALFNRNGFKTTVADPALFGTYLYEDEADITALNLTGRFNGKYADLFTASIRPVQKHHFLMFSLFRTAPLSQRERIYGGGKYMNPVNSSASYTQAFIDNYTVLEEVPNLMSAEDSEQGSFLFLQNCTTHEPVILEAPDYTVGQEQDHYDIPYGERNVDGRVMGIESLTAWKHYCCNMVACRKLAAWFEALKALGVYDNTRIILVADHGATVSPAQFGDLVLPDGYDIESVNPLLMVKDYHSRGALTTDGAFMTNADVPTLATAGVIEHPVNPFTGNAISSGAKKEGVLVEKRVLHLDSSQSDNMAPYVCDWWKVKENIFDHSNWELIEGKVGE